MANPIPSTAVERLVAYLLDGAGSGEPARAELAAWIATSPRFQAFVERNRDKIRKKLRGARDRESGRDVRAELLAARLLLADPGIELAFEAYGSGRAGPDFTVTFRGERPFNLEVTRVRNAVGGGYVGSLLAKLRQLPPSVPNAVVLAIEGSDAQSVDVGSGVRAVRARADRKDEAFLVSRGFEGSRGFYELFLRLGAVLVWSEGADGDKRTALWVNRSARIAVPERAARGCLGAFRGSP